VLGDVMGSFSPTVMRRTATLRLAFSVTSERLVPKSCHFLNRFNGANAPIPVTQAIGVASLNRSFPRVMPTTTIGGFLTVIARGGPIGAHRP
jgi:hypothetical protein